MSEGAISRKWLRKGLHFYWRLSRGMTLGVRAAVFDSGGRVLLVKHRYVPGWHFPGGGVEPGQSTEDALAAELLQEANVRLTGPAQLFGLYWNHKTAPRDHVALYLVREFTQGPPPKPNAEIAASGFHAVDALPEETTRGTRERLAEILDGKPRAIAW